MIIARIHIYFGKAPKWTWHASFQSLYFDPENCRPQVIIKPTRLKTLLSSVLNNQNAIKHIQAAELTRLLGRKVSKIQVIKKPFSYTLGNNFISLNIISLRVSVCTFTDFSTLHASTDTLNWSEQHHLLFSCRTSKGYDKWLMG